MKRFQHFFSRILTSFCTFALLNLSPSPAHAQINFDEINPVADRFNGENLVTNLLGGNGTLPGILTISIILGGLLLLVMLIAGGFTMLTNPTSPEGQAKGKQRITWAVVGFVLLFSSYWIIQILEIIFGIAIV